MIKKLFLIGCSCLVVGCAGTGPRQETRKVGYEKSLSAYKAYDEGNVAQAESDWDAAIAAVTKDPEAYAADRELPLQHSTYVSNKAWIALTKGDEKGAREGYMQAVDILAKGERAYQALEQSAKNQREMLFFAATLAASGYVAYKSAKLPVAQQPQIDYSQMLYIPKFDEVDIGKRFPNFFQTDGVRAVLYPSLGWMESIVRVNGKKGTCTGWVWGGVAVVTNAHCVTNEDGSPGPGTYSVAFERALGSESYKVVEVHTHRNDGGWDRDWANDWAILALDRYYPYQGLKGWWTPDNAADRKNLLGTKLMTAGYSGDLNDGRFLGMHWGCGALGFSNKNTVLEHKCRTWKGSSGSPIVIAEGKHAGYVVAMNSYVRGRTQENVSVGVGVGGGIMVDRFTDKLKEVTERRRQELVADEKLPPRIRY